MHLFLLFHHYYQVRHGICVMALQIVVYLFVTVGIDMHWAKVARLWSKITFLLSLPLKRWRRGGNSGDSDGDSVGVGGSSGGGKGGGKGGISGSSGSATTTPTLLSPLTATRHPQYHSQEDKGSDVGSDKVKAKDRQKYMDRKDKDKEKGKDQDKAGGLMIRSGAGTLRVLSAYGEIGDLP